MIRSSPFHLSQARLQGLRIGVRALRKAAGALFAAASGELASQPRPEFSDDVAVTVVLASEGYPEEPVTGRPITGLSDVHDVTIAHAATALVDGTYVATGGRVLSVVATGRTFSEARARVYLALDAIHLEGGHYRRDIGLRVSE